jgi:hypothetical protein
MENNQDELQQEEIPNIEQFQVGRVPAEDQDQLTDPQNTQDDEVELGFTEEAPEGEDPDDSDDDQDTEGNPGEEDADFDNPDDDPA